MSYESDGIAADLRELERLVHNLRIDGEAAELRLARLEARVRELEELQREQERRR